MLGTSIQIDLTLCTEIDETALRNAIEKTQKCYAALQLRPILKGGNIQYIKHDWPVKILHYEPNAKLTFGDKSTSYYPWFVAADKNTLSLVISHALVDGLGSACIMKTLIYYYAKEIGTDCLPDNIYTIENPMKHQDLLPNDTHIKMKPEKKPLPIKKYKKASCLRDEYRIQDFSEKRVVSITCDAKSFVQKAKELGTTPFALETLLCFKAMCPMMKGDDPHFRGSCGCKPSTSVRIRNDAQFCDS